MNFNGVARVESLVKLDYYGSMNLKLLRLELNVIKDVTNVPTYQVSKRYPARLNIFKTSKAPFIRCSINGFLGKRNASVISVYPVARFTKFAYI